MPQIGFIQRNQTNRQKKQHLTQHQSTSKSFCKVFLSTCFALAMICHNTQKQNQIMVLAGTLKIRRSKKNIPETKIECACAHLELKPKKEEKKKIKDVLAMVWTSSRQYTHHPRTHAHLALEEKDGKQEEYRMYQSVDQSSNASCQSLVRWGRRSGAEWQRQAHYIRNKQ